MLEPSVVSLIAGLIGVSIGGTVSLGAVMLNGRNTLSADKRKFLYEKRLQALEACAAALADRDEIFDAIQVARNALNKPVPAKDVPEALELLKLLYAWDRARMRFHSKVRARGIVLSATFSKPFPTVPPIALPGAYPQPVGNTYEEKWAELQRRIAEFRSAFDSTYKSFVETTEEQEKYLVERGRELMEMAD
jgi:hypothetical protein